MSHLLTAAEKAEFVANLCDTVRDDILKKVSQMPDEWDGHELRQFIKDKFAEVAWVKMDRGRKARYRNEVVCRNL